LKFVPYLIAHTLGLEKYTAAHSRHIADSYYRSFEL